MKNKILLFFAFIIYMNTYSQILFEEGYFVNNEGQKISCLIKNLDWKFNPTDFEYKLIENSVPQKIDIKSVKEFGISNSSKYVRTNVNMDNSTENINNLDFDRNPVFVQKLIFLKVLVEGNANLYLFENVNISKFFFNKENSSIEQLVYKIYFYKENNIAKNNLFKQQLLNISNCPIINTNKVENLVYTKKSLVSFFVEHNKCNNQEVINYEKKIKKDLINVKFTMHLNNSSLSIQNSVSEVSIDFGSKSSVGFGVEAEYILPFNKNKWAILVEPTYQNFKLEKTTLDKSVSGGQLISIVDYNSIELPFSLRHYLFLTKNSKIFINVSYVFDFETSSSIEFKRADYSKIDVLEVNSRNNFGFGLGYKFYDKYSLEVRYQPNRNILGEYLFWQSNYNKVSIIVGYSFF